MANYRLGSGTVQPVVVCIDDGHHFMHHFGRAEYLRELPVLTDSIREQAQPIVDRLNSGEITEEEAKSLLDKIYW